MPTKSVTVTQKSIPPRGSKSLDPDALKHIRNRLETSTKEYNKSKRRVNKVLNTMHINQGPVQPTRNTLLLTALPPRRLEYRADLYQKSSAAGLSGTTSLGTSAKLPSLGTPTPSRPRIIYRKLGDSIPKSKHYIIKNTPSSSIATSHTS